MVRRRLNFGIMATSSLGRESVKRETRWILYNRTENRERCPWLRMPRRIRITALREFGNLAPYLRYKGCLLLAEQVAVARGARLFTKNTGLC